MFIFASLLSHNPQNLRKEDNFLDFVKIITKEAKNSSKNREAGSVTITADFKVGRVKDLMTRGHAFYAVYDPRQNLWLKNEMEVVRLVDFDIMQKVNEYGDEGRSVSYALMEDYDSGAWQKYVSYIKNMPDNWTPLDNKIHFQNDDLVQSDYATKKLPYVLQKGSTENYDKLMSVL